MAFTNLNLNSTTPAAPAGKTNVIFQIDGSTPNNVSAYYVSATNEPAGLTTEVQSNQAGVLYADAGFTYTPITASINPATIFLGVANTLFSARIQSFIGTAGAGLQVNRLIPGTGPDVNGQDSAFFVFENDADTANDALDVVADFTNNAAGSSVGIACTVYLNTPMSATNANIQTCFEGDIEAYGAGTIFGVACFYSNVENTGTGTIENAYGYWALNNENSGGGAITNSFGFYSEAQTAGGTLNASYYTEDAGSSYAYYAVGGKNFYGGSGGTVFSGGGTVTVTNTAAFVGVNLVNTTVATSLANADSPKLQFSGQTWEGMSPSSHTITFNIQESGGQLKFTQTAGPSAVFAYVFDQNIQLQELNATAGFFLFSTGSAGATYPVTSVATSIGALATYQYTSPAGGQPTPGQNITISGFTNGVNNGTFVVELATGTTQFTVYNSAATIESHTASAVVQGNYYSQSGYDVALTIGATFNLEGTAYLVNGGGFEALPNVPAILLNVKGDSVDAGYLRILNDGSTGNHGLEIGAITDGTGTSPATIQLGHFNGAATALINCPLGFAGSSSTLCSKTVTISSAQLLAMPTPVTIVPAQGANTILVPNGWTIEYKYNTTPYTPGNADNSFIIQLASGVFEGDMAISVVSFADQTSSQFYYESYAGSSASTPVSTLLNNSLSLTLVGTTPGLTLGDGTLVVTIAYYVVTVS